MKNLKRPLALLMAAAALLALLSGCGGNKDPGAQGTPAPGSDPEFVYVASYLPMDKNISYINASSWYDGRLYFVGEVVTGKETYTDEYSGESWEYDVTEQGLFSCAEDGTDLKRLENYKTPELTAEAEQSGYGVDEPATNSDISVDIAAAKYAEETAEEEDTEEPAEDVTEETAAPVDEPALEIATAPVPMPEPVAGPIYMPEDSVYSYVQNMCFDTEGGLWVMENVNSTTYDLPEDFDPETDQPWDYATYANQYFVRKLDLTGAELFSLDLSALKGDERYFYVQNFQADGKGNLYLADGNSNIWCINPDGGVKFKLEMGQDGWVNSMLRTTDGNVAVTTYEQTADSYAMVMKPIDPEKKEFGKSVELPANAWNFYPGSGEYDFYYGESSLYGFNSKTGESTKILTWLNCDIDNYNMGNVTPLPDGRIFCVSYTYDETGNRTELVTLNKVPASEVVKKTTLTYACMNIDWNLRGQIIKFNKTNEKYRVEVQDYSEFNTEDDWQAGLTKLTTEILAGKVPDILSTSDLPFSQFSARGLFEDLWPYIDADAELGGREALVNQPFNAIQSDEGKLHQIFSSFSVRTAIGLRQAVGDKMGWTLQDLQAAYATLPEGADIFWTGMTKTDALSQLFYMSMDNLVNWETGECNFNSPEFVGILEFANSFPESFDWEAYYGKNGEDYVYEEDWTRLKQGKQLLLDMYLGNFNNIRMYQTMLEDDLVFVGYPTGDGSFGSAFNLESGLAMSSTCKNKEGAWEFMRVLLTEDFQRQNTWSFPTNKTYFDDQLKDIMTPNYYTDEEGNRVEQPKDQWWVGNSDEPVKIYAMSREQADEIMNVINSTNRIFTYDTQISEIIMDDCAAFFAGQKTAQQTAELIQSRINLYVNEQR